MTRLRLRYQLAFATFLPLVVFALLAGGVAAYALRTIPENLILERQTALAQVAAAGEAGNLRGYVRLLETTADELADSTGDLPRQRQIVQERRAVLGLFTAGASLLDADGTCIAATAGAEDAVGRDFADRDYFQQVKASLAPAFSTILPGSPSEGAAIVIAVPVRRGSAFAGVLLGKFALNRPEWARDLTLLYTPRGGQAYLVDSSSTIIFHPDARRIGQSIQAEPDLWRLVIAGRPGSMIYRSPDSGQRLIVGYAPVPGLAGGVITEEPWEGVLASVIRYQWAAGGLLALGIGLALAALTLSVRQITRPLDALVAASQRVANGSPYERLPVTGPPDLRTLIQAMNQMVAHLDE